MANITVQKIEKPGMQPLPIFEEMEKRFADVRQRAFELFEKRGRALGHALDDWFRAEHEVFGWPAAELDEKGDGYQLQMTLPGFDAGEVQVTATPSEIVVHAEIKPEKKAEEAKVLWTEFGPNNVCRRFAMPQPIDIDKTRATLDKGMLHITAAKAPAAQAKPIAVAAA
ncbi:MAG: Hsp20/alpha crystallin family protein [Acidobacteriia bacterium]|nr:Hsp20/alpha crystallin family protein [Terriglobia bacterium]